MKRIAFVTAAILTLGTGVPAWADDLNPVTFHDAPKHEDIVLVQAGQAVGEIVVHAKGRMTGMAARDLQLFIRLATGAEMRIVKKASGVPAIVIGDCPAAAGIGLTSETLPVEGLAIKTGPGAVYIVGHDDAGTAWGIYEFLERFVDIRWYWPEVRNPDEWLGTSIPKQSALVVEPIWLSDAPAFRKRHRYPSGGWRIGTADMSGHDRRLRAHNSWPINLIVHAPHDWATPYGKTRPEIFQLRTDGQRDLGSPPMLCYGNPLTLRTYLEEIELQLQAIQSGDPVSHSRITDGTSITVSPNDLSLVCRCKDCRALWDPNGGPYGTASRIMTAFVDKLAREVKRRWPKMTVVFLPYKNYTYAPHGVTFPDNVEVQICGMPGLAQHKDSVIHAAEQANIDAWVKASGRRIQNWHYSCWPEDRTKAAYLFPHTIQKHYRVNRDKTVGSFINGVKNHWPRQHVSLYCWLKVLWNPDFDVDAAIDAYCRRMYGPAAKDMRKLVHRLIAGWERDNWEPHVLSPKTVYEQSYPRKDVVRMEKLLSRAMRKADGDTLVTKRLDHYAVPLRAFFAESKDYAEGTGKTALISMKSPENPIIDGKLDDEAWKRTDPVAFVRAMDKEQKEPQFPTTMRSVWTWDGVTFGFRMTEPEPDKMALTITGHDAALAWWNDNVELFLDVTGELTGYYQLIVGATGAVRDQKGKDFDWDCAGLKTQAFIGKNFWTLEVYIPYSAFPECVKPATGVQWTGNFTRHRLGEKTGKGYSNREYQRLNTTYQGPSNNMMAFGPITFVE